MIIDDSPAASEARIKAYREQSQKHLSQRETFLQEKSKVSPTEERAAAHIIRKFDEWLREQTNYADSSLIVECVGFDLEDLKSLLEVERIHGKLSDREMMAVAMGGFHTDSDSSDPSVPIEPPAGLKLM